MTQKVVPASNQTTQQVAANGTQTSTQNGHSSQNNGQENGQANGPGTITETVKMKREIGLLDAISVIIGVIIGSGIFVSPKGVLKYSNSYGQALIVWVLSGIMSLIGALCYAELGTMIPKSGGDYAYINYAFGSLPAFLYLWFALFILLPTGNAITAITFAQYTLQSFWSGCEPPYAAVRLLAAVVTCLLTAINCWNVKVATKVQELFTGTKVLALVIIIISGIYWLAAGHTQHFQDPFEGSNFKPGYIALSMYSGIFSYAGYNFLTFITEELKEPNKNLPRAICISMPIVTIIYVMTNVAYFAVLTPNELLSSNAVAVTYGGKFLGMFSWIMPVSVACSTFGALNGAIFTSSRLFFVGARDGNLPAAISLINVNNLTPMPSVIFLCLITLAMLAIEDVYTLINYSTFSEAVFTATSVVGLLWLRYKEPNAERPIKINIILPIFFFTICIFLCILPITTSPWEVGTATVFILLGIPVYYVCVWWKNKPQWLLRASEQLYLFCAKLFMCVQEDKSD